jgi:hypothetical protein
VAAVIAVAVSALQAGDERTNPPAPREVTLIGKVVDLHCCMTGKFPSTDHAKCTRQCIMAGVPAALQTEDGLIVLGQGPKGAARTVADLAFKTVEVRGRLYEQHGLRYLDLTTAKALTMPEPPALTEEYFEEDEDDEGQPQDTGTDG